MSNPPRDPAASEGLEATRAAVRDLVESPAGADRVRRLATGIERLVEADPDPSLAIAAAEVALDLARHDADRTREAAAARAAHLAHRSAGNHEQAQDSLLRLRRAAEVAGDVDALYDATWLELLAAVTSGDRFGIRRNMGALRSLATAGRSHHAVALHRAARCLTDAIVDDTERGDGWPDGSRFVDDHRLRPVLSGWTALHAGRPEDARFAVDRARESGAFDRMPASLRPVALMVTGRVCTALRDDRLVPDLTAALAPHAGTFIVTGPSPLRWLGSVDLVLAELAIVVDDRSGAAAHLAAARTACQALGARSMTTRLDRVAAALGPDTGPDDDGGRAPATRTSTRATSASEVLLRRTGTMWRYRRGSIDVAVRHRKGLEQLRRLLAAPGREHHCVDLVQPGTVRQAGVEVLDQQAKETYRRRYEELTATIAESEAWNDDERGFRAREELAALADELSRGLGLGGRTRTAGSTVERARVNATRTIRAAAAVLAEHDPRFGAHLDRCLHTGTYCVYRPDGDFDITC